MSFRCRGKVSGRCIMCGHSGNRIQVAPTLLGSCISSMGVPPCFTCDSDINILSVLPATFANCFGRCVVSTNVLGGSISGCRGLVGIERRSGPVLFCRPCGESRASNGRRRWSFLCCGQYRL